MNNCSKFNLFLKVNFFRMVEISLPFLPFMIALSCDERNPIVETLSNIFSAYTSSV